MPERVIAVVGPTAAGKSELSLGLALALGGEVVNADSMQLYAGMDIGTAKLSPAQRRGVPHHLLDIWDVREAASVAAYQRLAREAIADIHARGRVPVLAGDRVSTCGPPWTTWSSPGPTRRCGAGWKPSWPRPAARCTRGSPRSTRWPRRRSALQRAADRPGAGGDRGGLPARSLPCCPSTSRGTRWCISGSGWAAASWTGGSRSGPRECGGKAWWTRWQRWSGPDCGRAGRPAVPSATRRCSASSPASTTRTRPRADRPGDQAVRPPAGGMVPPRPPGHLARRRRRRRRGRRCPARHGACRVRRDTLSAAAPPAAQGEPAPLDRVRLPGRLRHNHVIQANIVG